MIRRFVGFCLLLGLCQCRFAAVDAATIPEHPTFAQDVQPIFETHCVLCHGNPPNFGAPTYFRLDILQEQAPFAGAAAMAPRALERVLQGSMPPSAAWGDGVGPNDKVILQRWVDQGAQ